MKKELSIIFLLLVVILSVSVLAFNLPDLSPEKVFGIGSGMQTSDIVVRIATWAIVFFVLYGILRIFFGWFLGVLLAVGSIIVLGYFGIINSLLKDAVVIVTNLGALGIPLLIILAFIVAIIIPLASNRLAIWWIRTRIKLRARRASVFLISFFLFLIFMQFLAYAQEIPNLPNPGEQIPYALNRTKPLYEKTLDGIKNTCEAVKTPTKYLFGTECAMNLSFFISLVIFVFMLLILYDALTTFSTFSSVPGFFISLGLMLLIANMDIINRLSDSILFLIGTKTGIIILLAVLIIFAVAFSFLKKYVAQAKQKAKEKRRELAGEKLETITKDIT